MVPRCEHSFCKNCINEWLDQQRSCPVDRQSVTSSELKPVPRILKNFLSRLLITCDFADLGCTVVVKLELLETHEKECEQTRTGSAVSTRVLTDPYLVNTAVEQSSQKMNVNISALKS